MKVFLHIEADFRKSIWAESVSMMIIGVNYNFSIYKDTTVFGGDYQILDKTFEVDYNTKEIAALITGIIEDGFFEKHDNVIFTYSFDLTKGNHIKCFFKFPKDGGMESDFQIDWE